MFPQHFAPNVSSTFCTKCFLNILHQMFPRHFAPNVSSTFCTKCFLNILHQMFSQHFAPHWLTPLNIFLQELMVSQLIKKLSTLSGSEMFITVFTAVQHWPVESSPHHHTYLRPISVLLLHQLLCVMRIFSFGVSILKFWTYFSSSHLI